MEKKDEQETRGIIRRFLAAFCHNAAIIRPSRIVGNSDSTSHCLIEKQKERERKKETRLRGVNGRWTS